MAIGAAIIAVAGIGLGAQQQSQARKATREANRRAERIEALRERRDIVNRIREARISAASIEAAGASQGIGGSTPLVGAQGALFSDVGANISLAQQIGGLRRDRVRFLQRAESLDARASVAYQLGSSLSSIALSTYTPPRK